MEMATERTTAGPRTRPHPILVIALTAVAVNLAVWLIGLAANAAYRVRMGGQTITITPVHVVLTTLIALALGGLAFILARRWGPAAPRWLAVAGGAVGVLSASAPILQAEADSATTVALTTMHILTGAIWYVALWRPTLLSQPGHGGEGDGWNRRRA